MFTGKLTKYGTYLDYSSTRVLEYLVQVPVQCHDIVNLDDVHVNLGVSLHRLLTVVLSTSAHRLLSYDNAQFCCYHLLKGSLNRVKYMTLYCRFYYFDIQFHVHTV